MLFLSDPRTYLHDFFEFKFFMFPNLLIFFKWKNISNFRKARTNVIS